MSPTDEEASSGNPGGARDGTKSPADKPERVVSLAERRAAADRAADAAAEESARDEPEADFDSLMEKNRRNRERMNMERKEANKGVLRSYRIKS